MPLHLNIEDLLSARTVESDRIEFKEGWNPDAVYRSICAFANDFDNIGGGYILIGVAENPVTKTAMRPVKGLSTKQIGAIQQEMIGFNNLIKPYYAPRLFVEAVDGQQIIVLWINGGGERPYEVPETITAKHKIWKYFIRKYASSIEAKGAEKEELISLANNTPFDDRINTGAKVSDLSLLRLKDYLQKVNSKLAGEVGLQKDVEILTQMALVAGPAENVFPRNVALMLFTDAPHQYFPYSWVEIVHFPNGAGDKEFTEKKIEGPVHQQIIDTLAWLKSHFLQEKVMKVPNQAEAARAWNYPYPALEEAVANCLYHRNYQEREPVKIRVEPHAIIMYNCGGPDRSIKREDFASGRAIPKRYRNRRLGDFLKELKLTEGHSTGLPAMRKAMYQNGSPEPVFDFDEERTWFQVTLPVHVAFEQDNTEIPSSGYEAIDEFLQKTLLPHLQSLDTINSAIAGGIVKYIEATDNQIFNITGNVASDVVSAIASAIVETLSSQEIEVLQTAMQPTDRGTLLKKLRITNHRKNYERYVFPLVKKDWLAMTIPHKPTSPNQQYLTTKGRLLLAFLQKKDG
ncbi:MAG: putative DNA binding domain-containing protein [Haliscomenobacter sp.]|nr:RNA-binding domain-containing protein [Haliscomenobacter sp.]MBK9492300.1 putative DNA binding domain-containing protein [Haliscomenobacter sp.]